MKHIKKRYNNRNSKYSAPKKLSQQTIDTSSQKSENQSIWQRITKTINTALYSTKQSVYQPISIFFNHLTTITASEANILSTQDSPSNTTILPNLQNSTIENITNTLNNTHNNDTLNTCIEAIANNELLKDTLCSSLKQTTTHNINCYNNQSRDTLAIIDQSMNSLAIIGTILSFSMIIASIVLIDKSNALYMKQKNAKYKKDNTEQRIKKLQNTVDELKSELSNFMKNATLQTQYTQKTLTRPESTCFEEENHEQIQGQNRQSAQIYVLPKIKKYNLPKDRKPLLSQRYITKEQAEITQISDKTQKPTPKIRYKKQQKTPYTTNNQELTLHSINTEQAIQSEEQSKTKPSFEITEIHATQNSQTIDEHTICA